MERELVEYLAALTWRRRRVPVFEAGLIEAIRAEIDPAPIRRLSSAGAPTPARGKDGSDQGGV